MLNELEHIIEDYAWSKKDELNIKEVSDLLHEEREHFASRFYAYIMGFDEIEEATKSEREAFEGVIKHWFSRILNGDYDHIFFKELYRVGGSMAKKNLTPHHITAAAAFLRDYLYDFLGGVCDKKEDRDRLRGSAFKLIDISSDVISLAFRQEELSFYLTNSKFHRNVINFTAGFSLMLDMFLTFFLVLLAIVIGGYTAFEIVTLFALHGDVSKKALAILGNMLILWAIVELLEENIKHLKGAKFAIKVFVSVGLAAIVREILIASLAHNYSGLGFMTATLLALGLVYYLLGKNEMIKNT